MNIKNLATNQTINQELSAVATNGWQINVNYWTNQIANSCQHLDRNWNLLKSSKKLTASEIKEIDYNITIEDRYLKECEIKLLEAKMKLANQPLCCFLKSCSKSNKNGSCFYSIISLNRK